MDGTKNKIHFFAKDKKPLFLAGCYDDFHGEKRLTIITTAANDSVADIHDRMPLLIDKDDIETWLFSDNYRELLSKPMPQLDRYCEYEQLRLPF